MNTINCQYIDFSTHDSCDNRTEGNTNFCATHNKMLRDNKKRLKKANEKRLQLIENQKIKGSHPRPKPKQVSDKRKELNKEYSLLRLHYLANHMECEVKLLGCEATSIEIHHTYSGTNKVKHLNDVSTWKATCGHCHKILHDKLSAKEARELGLKITI